MRTAVYATGKEQTKPTGKLRNPKNQHTRWVARARCAPGAERDAVLASVKAVLLQGRIAPRGGKRSVFLRMFFKEFEMTIYIHCLSTPGGMEKRLCEAGIELICLRAGEDLVAGPLRGRGPSGLGRGEHTVPGIDTTGDIRTAFADRFPPTVLERLESVRRYDYGNQGVYVESGRPCERTFLAAGLPADHPTAAFPAGRLPIHHPLQLFCCSFGFRRALCLDMLMAHHSELETLTVSS